MRNWELVTVAIGFFLNNKKSYILNNNNNKVIGTSNQLYDLTTLIDIE